MEIVGKGAGLEQAVRRALVSVEEKLPPEIDPAIEVA
jgi:hypothetical protein